MEITNQKEYLRKYLSGSGRAKRKRKKKPTSADRVMIIDDDIDISQLQTPEEAIDLFHTNEDAPQVVGVIDERPMHLRVKDYTDSNKWKPVGEQTNTTMVINDIARTSFQIKSKNNDSLVQFKQLSVKKDKRQSSSNPVRQRQPVDKTSHTATTNGCSRLLSEDTHDQSPPRRNRVSPESSPHRDVSNDSSPPRRTQKSVDSSPPRKSQKNSNSSPPRRINSEVKHSDRSPSRLRNNSKPIHRNSIDPSPIRKRQQLEIINVKRKHLPGDKRGKYLIPAKRDDKMTKTLDGKTAGLQNAQELVKETRDFRKREDELFKAMDVEVSGVNAATILRDRKTGKIRDFAKEAEERKEKERIEQETKEKYMQWGKGLKQVEDHQDKLAQDLREMSKPLARYADDEDLERYLKERERDDDPMLQYIRRKKKKQKVESCEPSKPQYMGEFMPNRYGIVPGHRWDGVDRSNGYEQRWLEAQNAKLAIQEDIYKWSTEDM